VTARIADWNNL